MAGSTTKLLSRVLRVSLGDVHVGTITLLPADQTLFVFDDDYINDPNRPILSLSFKTASGGLRTTTRPTAVRLPLFFSNLLPEGHLRQYLAEQAGVHPDREFFLLAALRDDLPGAVRIEVAEKTHFSDEPAPPTVPNERDEETLRFSLAGIQLKFSALKEASGGLTIPAGGVNGHWIVKMPSSRFPCLPENEYSIMEFARKVGIIVPEVSLVKTQSIKNLPQDLPENFGCSLVVKRFDRTDDGQRIHTEDFAQVYGLFPEQKYGKVSYANIANLLWIETGEDGVTEFIRRLVFNIGIGNADMHIKNWSLIYRDGRTPRLAPGYDFVSTIAYLYNKKPALGMPGINNAMSDISMDSFRRLAAKSQFSETLAVNAVYETVTRMHDNWREVKTTLPLPSSIAEKIEKHMLSIPVMSLK